MGKKRVSGHTGWGSLALAVILGCALNLMARERLSPVLTALFPKNATNISGNFVFNGPMGMGDLSADIPSTRDCSRSNPQPGGIHIRLTVFRGELQPLIKQYAAGIPGIITDQKGQMKSLAESWKDNSQITSTGPINEEDVPGGTMLWMEYGGRCVMDENPGYRGVDLRSYTSQGAAFAEITIAFRGEAAQAKAMLVEMLDAIAKADFSKLATH